MSTGQIKQRPMRLGDGAKRDVRTQFGALCWRVHRKELQFALITSRRTRRWIIPKGWPVDDATPSGAAVAEAYEEAGLTGKIADVCLGIFSYTKEMDEAPDLPCVVAVFPLKVKDALDAWPEASERDRKWFSKKKAAESVDSPELAQIIRNFDPDRLP